MVNRLAIRTCILATTASLSIAAHADTGSVDGRNSVSKQAGVAQKIRVATGPAAAQAGGGISGESSSESDVKLQPVLVTATRRKENVKDVPISISVLGGAELDSSTYPDVGEALRRLPGLDTSSSPLLTGNGISLSIRGVATGSQFLSGPSPVAYYVDSVPFGLIRNSFLPDPDVYDLDSIEVLRGPQGTLYGANALNGVVRVLTHDPDLDSFGFKARASDSSTDGGTNNYRGDGAVNIPLVEGKLALRVTAGYEDDGGWIDSDTKKHINDSITKNDRVKLLWKPIDSLSVDLSAWHSENEFAFGPYSDQNEHTSAVVLDPSSTSFDAYGAKVANDFRGFTVTSMTSYFKYDSGSTLDGHPVGAALALFPQFRSTILTEEVDAVSSSPGPWKWSAGVFFRHAKDPYYETETLYPPYTPVATPGTVVANFYDDSKSEAIYGEVGRELVDNLELTVGLRYFRDEEVQQATGQITGAPGPTTPFNSLAHAVTPRVVLSWKLNPDMMTYVSYAQGFRSGLAQDQLVTVVYPDIPPVKPDRLTNYELGIKGDSFNGLLSYDAAVFYIHWADVQQVLDVPITGGLNTDALVNGQSASGPGVEASITLRPVTHLELLVNGSWNGLEEDGPVTSDGVVVAEKGDRLDFSPEYTVGGTMSYLFSLGGGYTGDLSLGANYRSPQFVANVAAGSTTSQPTFNAQSSLSIQAPKHWNTNLYVENLTNDYRSSTPPPGPGSTFEQWRLRPRPRTIGIQVEYTY
jgi:outer membrane receptor protein involved in Fe transport